MFRQDKDIVHLNRAVPGGAFKFCVAEKQLAGVQTVLYSGKARPETNCQPKSSQVGIISRIFRAS